MNPIIAELEASLLKPNLPSLEVGDTVKVFVKIKEGGKERSRRGEEVYENLGDCVQYRRDLRL